MGQYDFTYEIPANFNSRINQFLQQKNRNDFARAFQNCKYEYEDLGLAYYAGLKGDNWNKRALDFTLEGSKDDIELLKSNKTLLEDVIGKALRPSESGYLIRYVLFLVFDEADMVIPSSNEERFKVDLSTANSVLKDLIWIGERVCTNVTYNESTNEDNINDYFRDMLCSKGYNETKDQTRHGVSTSGKSAGEVDILLTKDGKEIALFEGLKLGGVIEKTINEHIDKAINNYNALGTATFIVAYVTAVNFSTFWSKYYNCISEYSYSIDIKRDMTELTSPNASTKVAQIILSKDGFDFPVFFICLNIRKN